MSLPRELVSYSEEGLCYIESITMFHNLAGKLLTLEFVLTKSWFIVMGLEQGIEVGGKQNIATTG